MLKLATAIERSGDNKLAACPVHDSCKLPCKSGHNISATYVAQESCPSTCPFRNNGCYAELGHTGIHTARLNRNAQELDANRLDIAYAEAEAIDSLSGRNPLRLHVVGDCSSDGAAMIVSNAANRYHRKYEQPVWTYTHAWRNVFRESWNDVSVLASCESDKDVVEATSKGYASALVREHDGLPKSVGGLKTIKCPQQTGQKLDCASCMLCSKDSLLKGKACIVFDPHGVGAKRIKAVIG